MQCQLTGLNNGFETTRHKKLAAQNNAAAPGIVMPDLDSREAQTARLRASGIPHSHSLLRSNQIILQRGLGSDSETRRPPTLDPQVRVLRAVASERASLCARALDCQTACEASTSHHPASMASSIPPSRTSTRDHYVPCQPTHALERVSSAGA